MSIVPYRAPNNGRVVYHDPASQILVIHNNGNNSVELYGSSHADYSDHGEYPPLISTGPLSDKRRRGSPLESCCCPHCGVDLTDFLSGEKAQNRFPNTRRSSSRSKRRNAESLARKPEENGDSAYTFSPLYSAGDAVQFMHQDYFHLLADLPYDSELTSSGRALEGPESVEIVEDQNAGLFNQGYFERFFRKIPPGILGSGAHAQVYKVAHVLKDIQLGVFAVKRINVGDHMHFLDQVLNEVLILYELSVQGANENNLIRYNHVWMEYGDLFDSNTYIMDPSAGSKPSRVPYVYILQQYCDGGHLENVIRSNFLREENMSMKERLDEERLRRREKRKEPVEVPAPLHKKWLSDLEIWKFFADITNGVAYLHAHGILHRDLKPSNCLLESKYDPHAIPNNEASLTESEFDTAVAALPKVLVSDFGEGKFLNKKHKLSTSVDEERRGNTGTIEFTDPKLWLFSDFCRDEEKPKFAHQFTYDSDIYSLGMILCYLCVGKLPFAEEITDFSNPEAVRKKIAKWHAALTPEKFSAWFDQKVTFLKEEVSPAMEDFGVLVYSMIKGLPNTSKPSPKMFMEYLDTIKWRRFILQRNRSRSSATIVEMGKLSAFKSPSESNSTPKDEILDDETLDLVSLAEPAKENEDYEPYMNLRKAGYRAVFIRSVYIVNLALIETFARPSGWITVLKLGNAVALACETLHCNDYGMHLVSFWFLLSLAGVSF